jgi:CheY-like chemotaxis protein
MVLSSVLKRANFCCVQANSAMEAFEMILDRSFSLILMDIEMPEVNGFEAATYIRHLNCDYFRTIPIIALTAHPYNDVIKKAKTAQMNDVMTKPFDLDDFISKTHNLMSRHGIMTDQEAHC